MDDALHPAFREILARVLQLPVPIAGSWGHEAVYHGLDVNTLKASAVRLVGICCSPFTRQPPPAPRTTRSRGPNTGLSFMLKAAVTQFSEATPH